jgi:hypothetical protein
LEEENQTKDKEILKLKEQLKSLQENVQLETRIIKSSK